MRPLVIPVLKPKAKGTDCECRNGRCQRKVQACADWIKRTAERSHEKK